MHSPRDVDSVLGSEHMTKSSNRVMKFKTLVNAFNTNDAKKAINLGDYVRVFIYSDIIDDLFMCGSYRFDSGDMLDMRDLEVPCNDHVIVTLVERDFWMNDGHSILIPCKPGA